MVEEHGRRGLQAIGDDIRYVQEKWTDGVGKPYVDGFGAGLYEVRTKYDKKQYRVLFCIEDDTIILLHGFIKKTTRKPRPPTSTSHDTGRKNDDDGQETLRPRPLDSLFEELGELDEMNERLSKRIYAERPAEVMRRRKISLSEFARRMKTSRTSRRSASSTTPSPAVPSTHSAAPRARLEWRSTPGSSRSRSRPPTSRSTA